MTPPSQPPGRSTLRPSRVYGSLVALACVFCSALGATPPANEPAKNCDVQIGLVSTLFRDIPPAQLEFSTKMFRDLMQAQTGLTGTVVTASDASDLGRLLQEGKVHLGVFHGVEFAWAQERFANLEPLMIAVNRQRHLHANLVVHCNSAAKDFADLKQKTLALPCRSREHCRLFLERHCRELGSAPKEHFDKIVVHKSIEDALDDVIRGKVDAAVVDSVSLDFYGRLKPGPHSALKVLKCSEVFPASVIVYRKGAIKEATLQRFRKGLLEANRNPAGENTLKIMSLTAFELIPEDYQKTLSDIRKAYPAPDAPKTSVNAPLTKPN